MASVSQMMLIGMGTAAGGGGGTTASNFLARTSGLDSTHIAAYTALLNGLDTDGITPKLDVLHVYATQNSTTALLNLVSTNYNGTATGSPTFTADRGFTGVHNSSVYIDPAFNPSSASSPNFVQNSAHNSAWNLSNITDGFPCMGSSVGSWNTDLFPKDASSNNALFFINDSSGFSVANPTATGQYISNRSASNATQGYKNGSSIVTGSGASVAVGNSRITILGQNVGTGSTLSVNGASNQIAMASIGSSLSSTDASNFYSRLRTYMTTVGVP